MLQFDNTRNSRIYELVLMYRKFNTPPTTTTNTTSKETLTSASMISIVMVLVLLLLFAILFIMKKKRTRNSESEVTSTVVNPVYGDYYDPDPTVEVNNSNVYHNYIY